MNDKPLNILVSAYACGPNWGSEIGMGWNWVINLSNYCRLYVITEIGFKNEIEDVLPGINIKYTPQFYYEDIGDRGRELFWKQGSFSFYKYYNTWQQKALKRSKKIINCHQIDLIHQLNMIGFREPGYLWSIKDKPFVWGPVGGFNQMPLSYMWSMSAKDIFFYCIKNGINQYQKRYLSRVQQSAKRANVLIAATSISKDELDKISGQKSYLIGETGCEIINNNSSVSKSKSKIKILWVGRLQALKALPIAIKTLSKIRNKIDFEFIIIGDGPDEKKCKRLAKNLQIDKNCTWLGRISNKEVINNMKSSNFFFFTSLKEGTPHVITEAIQNGLPVICHDACGHGTIINETCGLKIPMINSKTSVKLFSEAVLKLALDFELQLKLSDGALKRAQEVTWTSKVKEMLDLYKTVL